MQQYALSLFAQTEETTGASLPQFVKDEFDVFLECGILAHGLPGRRYHRLAGSHTARVRIARVDLVRPQGTLIAYLRTHATSTATPVDVAATLESLVQHAPAVPARKIA